MRFLPDLLAAALLLGGNSLHAQQAAPNVIDVSNFCGINDSVATSKLKTCEAQDAENVLTDEGGLRQIPGFTTLLDGAVAGANVRNMWEYRAPSGTKYLVFQASSAIYHTNFAGAPTLLRNVDSDFDVDAVQAFDKIFFVNGSEDLWYWDEVSTTSVAGIICTLIDFADERLYCGNTSGNSSELRTSDFGDFTSWTITGDIATDPSVANSFSFQEDDGDQISCLKITPCGKFVGKPHSTHILKGFDNDTYYKRIIDPDIGCVDDRYVQLLEGSIVWLSLEGVYAWDCRGAPKLISEKIDNRVKQIRQLRAFQGERIVNTPADWEDGLFSTNGPRDSWDTTIVPGEIRPSSATLALGTTALLRVGAEFDGTEIEQTFDGAVSVGSVISTYTFRYEADLTPTSDGWTLQSAVNNCSEAVANSSITFTLVNNSGCANTYLQTYSPSPSVNSMIVWRHKAEGPGAMGWNFRLGRQTTFPPNFSTLFNIIGSTSHIDYGIHGGHAVEDSPSGFGYSTFTVVMTTTNIAHVWRNGVWKSSFSTVSGPPDLVIWGISTGLSGGSGDSEFTLDFHYLAQGAARRPVGLDIPDVSTFTTGEFDTLLSTPIPGPFGVVYTTAPNTGIGFSVGESTDPGGPYSFVSVQPGEKPDVSRRYLVLRATMTHDGLIESPGVSEMSLVVKSSGVYSSEVQFLSNDITTFNTIDFETVEVPAGLLSFQTRTSPTVFAATNTAISWVDQDNHITIATTPNPYLQFRIISGAGSAGAGITSSSQTIQVSRVVINWNEGEANRGASVVHDRRYFMAVTTELGSTVNNSVEILQQNNEWTRMTGKAVGAMTLYDNKPTAASGNSDSDIWRIMDEGVNTFAGDTINAFWKTPDFTSGRPHSDKIIREIWVDAEQESGSSVEIGFSVDRGTSTVFETVSLDGTKGNAYVNERIHFPEEFDRGRYHNLTIRNFDFNEFFELNRLTIFVDVEPRFE